MALGSGTRIGPYEIEAGIGAGGMGEVYRARDTRLGRAVALKILPEHLSDATRRERFQREARAVAALNHPHICTIHDVGHDAGVDYLVMELVDGESLAARLARGALPVQQAIALAIEIADALATAHRRGIVHRDLKPGNVMLTKAGSGKPHAIHAKLLDFGLAGLVRPDAPLTDDPPPTVTAPLTSPGAALGTLQYMSPEQIEGRAADVRTDVFAFGALVFEMVTGRRAFEGSSSPSLLAAILRGETPSLVALQPSLPSVLDRLVRTCLEKDPDDRFASMHDVLLELRWIASGDATDAVPARGALSASRRSGWLRVVAIAVAVLAAAAAGHWAGRLSRARAPVTADRLSLAVLPPDGVELGRAVAVSPDGRSLAATAQEGIAPPLFIWVRSLGADAPRRINGTERGNYPFWSPDSQSIAFFADGKLKRVNLAGGTPVSIGDVEEGRGGVWFDDGTIVFAALNSNGLMRIPAAGGAATDFLPIEPGSGIANFRFPSAIGSRRLVYLAFGDDEADSELRMTSLDAPQAWKTLVRTQRSAAYANGFLFFDREGVMVAQPFDEQTGALAGEPVPITERPLGAHIGHTAFTAGGRTLAWRAQPQATSQLTWLDRAGVTVSRLGEPGPYDEFALAPDDRRVAVVMPGSLWIMDTTSGARQLVANGPSIADPRWSPDGTRVAVVSARGPNASLNLYSVAIGRPLEFDVLAEAPLMLQAGGWGPGGQIFWLQPRTQTVRGTRPGPPWFNLRGVLMRAPGAEPALVTADADPAPLAVSRDGTAIAYSRRLGGQWEICMEMVAAPRGCQPVAWNGTERPTEILWQGDGRELIFRAGDDVMAVPVRTGASLTSGPVARLFQPRGTTGLAVTSDGRRFLVREARTEPPSTISVAINWTPESAE